MMITATTYDDDDDNDDNNDLDNGESKTLQ